MYRVCAVTVVKVARKQVQNKWKETVKCYWLSIPFSWMWITTPIICFWWEKKEKKKQFLASCGGGSEEVLNYILSWKYTSCHLSLDVRVFHLAWKFRLIGNLFLKKKKIICQALWCVVHIFVLESQEAQTITEKCKLNFPSYSLTLEWC